MFEARLGDAAGDAVAVARAGRERRQGKTYGAMTGRHYSSVLVRATRGRVGWDTADNPADCSISGRDLRDERCEDSLGDGALLGIVTCGALLALQRPSQQHTHERRRPQQRTREPPAAVPAHSCTHVRIRTGVCAPEPVLWLFPRSRRVRLTLIPRFDVSRCDTLSTY